MELILLKAPDIADVYYNIAVLKRSSWKPDYFDIHHRISTAQLLLPYTLKFSWGFYIVKL